MQQRSAISALILVTGFVAVAGCSALTGVGDLTTSADLGDAGSEPEASDPEAAAPDPDAGMPAPPPPCAPGTKRCDGSCVDITDPTYGCGSPTCDRCSVPFAATVKCAAGACAVATCAPGRADCNGSAADGCEADLTLPATCGSCMVACPQTSLCAFEQGGCVAACPGTTTQCGSSCVDLMTSSAHCGACTKVCPAATNAVPSCSAGKCAITCNTGFADCDANLANGCEPKTAYYTDADKDGHGATGAVKVGDACVVPAGFTALADDCNDNNDKVFPGQTAYFDSPYTSGAVQSFDYDCNGVEDLNPAQQTGGCGPPCVIGNFAVPLGKTSYCGSNVRVKRCNACDTATDFERFRCK